MSPSRICGTRLLNIQDAPAELEITSNRSAGATPARMPSAIASAAAAICTPASNWLMVLTVEPGPARSPSR